MLLNGSPISRLLAGVKMSPVSLRPSGGELPSRRRRQTCERAWSRSGAERHCGPKPGAGKTGGAKCEVARGFGAPLVVPVQVDFFCPPPLQPREITSRFAVLRNCARQVRFCVKVALSLPYWELPSSLSTAHFYWNLSAAQRRGRDGRRRRKRHENKVGC